MRPLQLVNSGLAILATSICTTSAGAQTYFAGTGFISGDTTVTLPYGISANGQVVVGEARATGHWEGFRWSLQTGIVSLGPGQFGQDTVAFSASADGSVIVGRRNGAARWTEATGWQTLGFVGEGGAAYGITPDGQTIVGERSSAPFRWNAQSGFQSLPLMSGSNSGGATAISADGSVIVGFAQASFSGTVPVRWTSVGISILPGLESNQGAATAVTPDGTTIIGWGGVSGPQHKEAFRFRDDTGAQHLGVLHPGDSSYALAQSSDGMIVGGRSGTSLTERAFIWTPQLGMRDMKSVLTDTYGFNLSGWTLTTLSGISADGLTFCGEGLNALGQKEGWIAHIPVPASLPPLLGLLMFAKTRRRRTLT